MEEYYRYPREIEVISREYQLFKRIMKTRLQLFVEKLATTAGRIIKVSLSPEERTRLKRAIEITDLDLAPEDLSSLAFLVLLSNIGLTFLSLLLGFLIGAIAFAALGFYLFFYIKNFPINEVKKRMARASGDLVSAILYVSIYMRHISNLENAIKFASDNLTGYLAFDFKKMLWDVESRRYEDVEEALDHYLLLWKEVNPEFVDSMYLIRSTLYQTDEKFRVALLDESITRIIDETYRRMVDYAGELRNPINTIYMMGIVLPVLGMVLFPMLTSIAAGLVSAEVLIIGYNLVLPFFVYFIVRGILQKRPAGFPVPDVSGHPEVPKKHHFFLGKKQVPAIIPTIAIFALVSSPFWYYLTTLPPEHEPSQMQIYMSLFLTLAIGLAIYTYTKLVSSKRMKILSEVYSIERDFAHAVFQFGSLLSQGTPSEQAILKVADSMKGSETAGFLNRVVMNMRRLGLSFSDSLFHPSLGAVWYYPSPMIRSSMQILLETSKKSLSHGGISLIYVSRYLRNLQAIDARVKDVLDDVLSSMHFQIIFLSPIIAGIVVGMTSLITMVLYALSQKVAELTDIFGTGEVTTTFMLGIFTMTKATPLHVFQVMVGVYMIEVVILIAYTIANIERVGDPTYRDHMISKMILPAILIFTISTALITLLLGTLAELTMGVTQVFGGPR
jgi:uncharacterized membrane protein